MLPQRAWSGRKVSEDVHSCVSYSLLGASHLIWARCSKLPLAQTAASEFVLWSPTCMPMYPEAPIEHLDVFR